MKKINKLKTAFMMYPQAGHRVEDMPTPESSFGSARKVRGNIYALQGKLLNTGERVLLKEEGRLFRETYKKSEEHVP